MSIRIRKGLCPQNHPCPAVRVCPSHAIKQQGFSQPTVDAEKCINCGRCLHYCPYGVFTR
ncbi:MAG: 4Fe-4S binding protein [Spirochaetia bacterium]|nr:4Fe-4S binding protein [Spirochaetia bacterium]